MHVMCHMRRRIHACHVSYEEEDTCMSYVICHMSPNFFHLSVPFSLGVCMYLKP